MKFTILGSGNAGGVPLFGCDCAACLRAKQNPSYRRESACALIETAQTRVLIDAGFSDLGERFPRSAIDTILLTHFHMDHVQGLFRIRWGVGKPLPVIGPHDADGCDDLLRHPGILDFNTKAAPLQPFQLADLTITPLPLAHSRPTVGYRIDDGATSIAYLTDTCGLPAPAIAHLRQQPPDWLILDCSFPPRESHPRNHNDVTRAVELFEQLGRPRCLLTHVGHELDSWLMEHGSELPERITVAHDAMQIALDEAASTV